MTYPAIPFTDGTLRPVPTDPDGRQWVEAEGERVYGQWLPPNDGADELVIIKAMPYSNSHMTHAPNDEQAFLNAIRARPDDASPLLVFADWLRDQGREDEEADMRHRACRLPAVRKALTTLAKAKMADDTESAHSQADDALCDLLAAIGYGDVVEAYHSVDKWYL